MPRGLGGEEAAGRPWEAAAALSTLATVTPTPSLTATLSEGLMYCCSDCQKKLVLSFPVLPYSVKKNLLKLAQKQRFFLAKKHNIP